MTDPTVQALLDSISAAVGDNYTPPTERVLRFLEVPAIRCVILGQDPYPQPGVATGRAFEVGGVESWADKQVNSALKNILKALYRTRKGLAAPAGIAEIRADRSFAILPPHELFDHWARQGVLLLNTALTCAPGQAGSHADLWAPFTERVIRYIRATWPEAVWLLWGGHARRFRPLVEGAPVLEDVHPTSRDGSFPRTECFQLTANLIDWYG